ncbi:MAG: hypothetical protein MJH09_07345 [Cetobacterium sp.]|nr:hypothetical protein [Cetobacterium sp.]
MIFKNLVYLQNEIQNEWIGIEVLELEIRNMLKNYEDKEKKIFENLENNIQSSLSN